VYWSALTFGWFVLGGCAKNRKKIAKALFGMKEKCHFSTVFHTIATARHGEPSTQILATI